MYLYIKSLHIIFVVTWFSGLFYIVRLFIYMREAQDKDAVSKQLLTEQFAIMQKRLLYGITWPSAVLTLLTGLYLVIVSGFYTQLWMQVKIAFLIGLYLYHFYCQSIFNQQTKGVFTLSSNSLRLINEIATVFLVAIVFLVVLKQIMSMIWAMIGLLIFVAVLMTAIYIYKKYRIK